MTVRVPVRPELLRWALARSGKSPESLARRFRKLPDWLAGRWQPTLHQLEEFARATRTAFGYFLLPEPPSEELPIPDLRTGPGARGTPPSVDLLETIYLCQQRQAWYRDYALLHGEPPLEFIGSASRGDDTEEVAAEIRETVGLTPAARRECPTWTDALRQFIRAVEDAGILVMVSGVVGSNTHRPLNVDEFRGFALVDDLAPLVFLNGRDTKAAQQFTLAHELAHLWLGEAGVTDAVAREPGGDAVERWCNAVAAEVLVPLRELTGELEAGEALGEALRRLARRFKVSTLVILRRLFDAGTIDRETLEDAWEAEVRRLVPRARRDDGGDFYRTLNARVGRRFARAVIASTLEGKTPFTDAFRLLGVRRTETFYEEARQLGML